MKNVPAKPPVKRAVPGKGEPIKDKKKKLAIVAAFALTLFFGGWFIMAGDARMAHLMQVQEDLVMNREGMAEDEYREKMKEFYVAMKELPKEQRRELERAGWQARERREDRSAAAYFAMSAAERKAIVDQEIAKQKAFAEKMKAFKAKAGAGGPGGFGRGPGGPGGPGGGPGGPGGFARGPGGPGGGPGGPGGGPGGPGGKGGGPGGKGGPPGQPGQPPQQRPQMTAEQADSRTRSFLLHSTPQARAGRDQKRLDVAAARIAAGLPMSSGKGGFGGGFGRGR